MNRSRFLMLALWMCAELCWSQTIAIRGRVTDTSGEPILGANVLQKGTSNGTSTDMDGYYELRAGPDVVLTFSYIGFTTQELPVNGREVIHVTLEENLESLEEVVVIGYGTQLRENISGSVSSIQSGEIENIPQVSIDQLMQGKAAGVSITNDSGQPGSAVSVRIRGVTSITGSNEPLYVIDGVFVSGDATNSSTSGRTAAESFNGSGQMAVSPLAALNPSDIESIDVLKDASATAIYGSLGANGVVIITTKKGRKGEGKITYNSYVSVQRPISYIKMMDLPAYAQLQNDLSPLYMPEPRADFANIDLLGPGTNWQEAVFREAFMHNHEVAFSGGSDNVDYYISGSYLDQEGTVIASDFNRITVRANINARLKPWARIGASLTASRTDENITLNGDRSGIVSLGLLQAPDVAVYNTDGSFAYPENDNNQGAPNPVANALNMSNTLRRDRIMGSLYSEFTLWEGLTFRTEFAGDFGYNRNDRFNPTTDMGRFSNLTATLNVKRENTAWWKINNLLTYNRSFGRHTVNVMAGQEAWESDWEGVMAGAAGFVSNGLPILSLGDSDFATNQQYKGSSAMVSYFGRVIYNFDNRYGITASYRADRSSKFDPVVDGGKNQWGYFPSISASWNISNEPFAQNLDAVQNIRLKAGYGATGNQNIPNYRYGVSLATYPTGLGTGFALTNIANPGLRWESAYQTNIGLDFSLFRERFSATVEWYNKTSKDFLYPLALPGYLVGGEPHEGGVGAPYVNLGEMRNRGVDVTLGYQTRSTGKFSWNSTLTVSHYKNKVIDLLEGLSIPGETRVDDVGTAVTITEVGRPLGLYYGYKTAGLFNDEATIAEQPIQFGRPFSPEQQSGNVWLGDVQYVDINGDGVIDERDLTVIGNPHPDFTFGFSNTFRYGNIDLTVFLQGSYGNDLLNLTRRETSSLNRLYTNNRMDVADYWTPENRNTGTPRLTTQEHDNKKISDRWVEDGSYLRIQNVTLGYTLPKEVTEKFRVNRLKLYASVQNLYTFTSYSGYDPEVGAFNQDALLMGVDNGRYPASRTVTLGLNLEF